MHLPVCVWAVPAGLADGVDELQRMADLQPEIFQCATSRDQAASGEASDLPDRGGHSRSYVGLAGDLGDVGGVAAACRYFQVLSPSYRSALLSLDGPLTQDCDEVLHLVQTSLVQPAFPTPFALLPALPQPQAGLATLVVVPEWVPGSLRRVVIYDFSAFRGPVYAQICYAVLTLQDLAAEASWQGVAAWEASTACSAGPICGQVLVDNGTVIQFLPPGSASSWGVSFGDMLRDPGCWRPEPALLRQEMPPTGWLVLQGSRHRYYRTRCMDPTVLRQPVADAMLCEVCDVSYSAPLQQFLVDGLLFHGHMVLGVFAAEPRSENVPAGPNLGVFLFLDGRPVGQDIQFQFVSAGLQTAGAAIRYLQPYTPPGFQAMPFVGGAQVDEIDVVEGFVLTAAFQRDGLPAGLCDAPAACGVGSVAALSEADLVVVRSGLSASSEDGEASSTSQIAACFLVLCLDYAPAWARVSLHAPASIADAEAALASALPGAMYHRCPQVRCVSPQPSSQWGLAVALPVWAREEVIVVLNLLRVDGRLFATTFAFAIDRQGLCRLADVEPDMVDIYAYGSAQALLPHQALELEAYGCINFVPRGSDVSVGHSLAAMLHTPYGWFDPGGVPAACPALPGHYFCLVHARGSRLCFLPSADAAEYLAVFCGTLGFRPGDARVQFAVPRVEDAALLGRTCRGVVAVASLRDLDCPADVDEHVLFLVDGRPLLQGWSLWWARGGLFAYEVLAESLLQYAPPGHAIQFEGVDVNDDGDLITPPGAVVVAHLVPGTPRPHYESAESSDPDSDDEDSDGFGSGDSDEQDTTTAPAASDQEHLFDDGAGPGSRAAGSRSRSPRRFDGPHDGLMLDRMGWLRRLPCVAALPLSVEGTLLDTSDSVVGGCLGSFLLGCSGVLCLSLSLRLAGLACALGPSWLRSKLLQEPDSGPGPGRAAVQAARVGTRRLDREWPFFEG